MKEDARIRIKVNPQAIVKLTTLISNSIILSSNAFLLGAHVRRQIKEKKTNDIANKLQLLTEVASAIAGLARVIVNTMQVEEP